MNVLIFGAGAVGLGLASCLLKAGIRLDLVARKETADALKRDGLERLGIFGEYRAAPDSFGCYENLRDLPEGKYDFTLVCVKSFDSETAARELADWEGTENKSGNIVLCQNGWGNAEIFCEHFPSERIKNARVITGFRRPRKHQVEITVHAEPLHLGDLFSPPTGALQALADVIDAGGLPCRVSDAIAADLWAKMLYNCALNALGAVLRVPYGLLGESESSRAVMRTVAGEVFAAMTAAGYSTHWTSADDYLKTFYEKLLPATYKHESSMLQDLRAGRRTEIDALNGAIVDMGEKHGVPVPINQTLTGLVKFLESNTPATSFKLC